MIEKLFVGQAGEMTSVYYLDEGRLRMDHYCSLGNQPRMVAIASEGDELTFELLGVDNMPDPDVLHISSHALEFTGPGGQLLLGSTARTWERVTGPATERQHESGNRCVRATRWTSSTVTAAKALGRRSSSSSGRP